MLILQYGLVNDLSVQALPLQMIQAIVAIAVDSIQYQRCESRHNLVALCALRALDRMEMDLSSFRFDGLRTAT
jgi:hypothetical protein